MPGHSIIDCQMLSYAWRALLGDMAFNQDDDDLNDKYYAEIKSFPISPDGAY